MSYAVYPPSGGNPGTVTSISLADGSITPIYTISGSPVTSSGTLTFTLNTESANSVFAGPTSGGAAQPTFRNLVASDIPSLAASYLSTTLGTANGLSVTSTNTLNLGIASTSTTGALTSTDWNTFNGKQGSGNYITALTGDVTASGPGGGGSAAATLAATTNGTLTSLTGLTTASNLVSIGTITTGTWAGTLVAINHGGTGVTSATTAPAASAFAGWDANKNLSANNFIDGYATTGTVGGTTALSVSSAALQFFTGSSNQTVTMPAGTAVVLGQQYTIVNNSTGTVTVQSSGGGTIQAMAGSTQLVLTCILASGTTAASWSANYMVSNSPITFANIGGSPNAQGASISGSTITLQAASGSFGGLLTSATQTIGGAKQIAMTDGSNFQNAADNSKIVKWNLATMSTSVTLTTNYNSTTSQTLNYPNITATDTLATLGLAQTFSGALTLSANLTLSAGSSLLMNGSGSGTVSIKTQASAGTFNFNLPITAGSSGNVLTSAAGGASPMTWTAASSTAAASTIAEWDANVNLNAANMIEQLTSTATASGTTTLTVSSNGIQVFTGSQVQNMKLPVAATLANGQTFTCINQSTQVVTVQTSATTTLVAVAANQTAVCTCVNSAGGTGTASWGYQLTAATNLSNPMNTLGDTIYGGASGAVTRLAGSTTNTQQVLAATSSGGVAVAPAWTTLTAPTKQLFTSVPGPVTGYLFQVSGISVAPTAGATYTNNSVTYTVIGTTNSNTLLWCSVTGAQTFSGSTLTKTGGTGDASVTFSSSAGASAWVPQKLGTYATPAGATIIKITTIGGGGAGGSCATAATTSAAGGGGGAGGTSIKWIASPAASYFYCLGAAGSAAATGNNAGNGGAPSGLGSGTTFFVGLGGTGGSGGATQNITSISAAGGAGGSATGGDLLIPGEAGGTSFTFGILNALSGYGGNSILGFGGVSANGTSTGVVGTGYGGAGSGGCQTNNGAAQAGGVGVSGLVLVEEFYQ